VSLARTYADVEGALVAWAKTRPGLTGAGHPLAAGVHLTQVRSPAEGAIAYVEVIDRASDDVADVARVSFTVAAKKRATAELGARSLADELDNMADYRPVVTTSNGEDVALFGAGGILGPAFGGDFGGEVFYRVDADVVAQPR
jgi:hypothetical protein